MVDKSKFYIMRFHCVYRYLSWSYKKSAFINTIITWLLKFPSVRLLTIVCQLQKVQYTVIWIALKTNKSPRVQYSISLLYWHLFITDPSQGPSCCISLMSPKYLTINTPFQHVHFCFWYAPVYYWKWYWGPVTYIELRLELFNYMITSFRDGL